MNYHHKWKEADAEAIKAVALILDRAVHGHTIRARYDMLITAQDRLSELIGNFLTRTFEQGD